MAVQRLEIRIVPCPGLGIMIGIQEQPLQEIECFVAFAHRAIEAGDIVLGDGIVRINGDGARGPCLCPFASPNRARATAPSEAGLGFSGFRASSRSARSMPCRPAFNAFCRWSRDV